MDNSSGKNTPIVKTNRDETEGPEAENDSLRNSANRLAAQDVVETQNEVKTTKKKTRGAKGLHLPVRAFKSREDRDPLRVNDDLKVNFDDVINEPEGFYTPKVSWHLSHELYGFGKGCCYSITTFFCGIPIAFIWGIIFAFVACINVWCFAPCRRGHIINMSCLSGFWSTCISAVCDPFYRSIGLIFDRLHIRTEKFIV